MRKCCFLARNLILCVMLFCTLDRPVAMGGPPLDSRAPAFCHPWENPLQSILLLFLCTKEWSPEILIELYLLRKKYSLLFLDTHFLDTHYPVEFGYTEYEIGS